MKIVAIAVIGLLTTGCREEGNNRQNLQAQIDSLQHRLDNSYKPGFGEFMSGIQIHHAKLWFAGKNQNWKLADFEVHEIEEALEDIQKFDTDRIEAKAINMINPALDSVNTSIHQRDVRMFKSSFSLLTNTCNKCHRETEHEFNVVTIPSSLPVVNQNFEPIE
jgi:hypothetical protein